MSLDLEGKANNILRMLFADVEGDEMTRGEALKKISLKTFHNYAPMLYSAGLAEGLRGDATDSRRVTKLRLTEKGREVVNSKTAPLNKLTRPTENNEAEHRQPLSLDEITLITDEFNRNSGSWEWRLVRKEVGR